MEKQGALMRPSEAARVRPEGVESKSDGNAQWCPISVRIHGGFTRRSLTELTLPGDDGDE